MLNKSSLKYAVKTLLVAYISIVGANYLVKEIVHTGMIQKMRDRPATELGDLFFETGSKLEKASILNPLFLVSSDFRRAYNSDYW